MSFEYYTLARSLLEMLADYCEANSRIKSEKNEIRYRGHLDSSGMGPLSEELQVSYILYGLFRKPNNNRRNHRRRNCSGCLFAQFGRSQQIREATRATAAAPACHKREAATLPHTRQKNEWIHTFTREKQRAANARKNDAAELTKLELGE